MARVAALGTDLMLLSRVSAALEGSGHQVERAGALPEPLEGVDLVVADLDAVDPERLAGLEPPVLGFYRHTDVETKRRAEAAGLELTVPRSRLVRELPELAERLLSA
ncbi:MAG: hypothetical protein ACRDL6_00965 [Solirubrobacterales bacterium]